MPAPEAPIIENRADDTEDEQPADDGLPAGTSIWEGEYTCAQGLTRLRLEIEHDPSTHQVEVHNSFWEHPDNPGVPSGSFTMTGRYDPESYEITLEPQKWLEQPPDYVMIGLNGNYSPDEKTLSGTVNAASCGAWHVTWKSGDIELR